jgi:hypothetical protein
VPKQRISTAANPRDRHRPRTGKRNDREKQRKRRDRMEAMGLPRGAVKRALPHPIGEALNDDDALCTPEVLAHVEALAADLTPHSHIAASLHVTRPRYNRLMERPDFSEAWQRGHDANLHLHSRNLNAAAANGDTIASMFVCKAFHGKYDRPDTSRSAVVINMPQIAQPMTREDYLRALTDVTPRDALPAPDEAK